MKSTFKTRLALGSAMALTALISTPALAQDATIDGGLDEIVVTADKTGERALQETPIAVSVVDGDLMEAQGLRRVEDIATYVPGLTVGRNISASFVTVRGIGSNGGSEPSVATQVDGVYMANSVAFTEFADIERVEVLRGPQGTLYGRNTTGGSINFISRQPSDEFGGRLSASYGNYGATSLSAYVTGPIAGDELTASLAVTRNTRDPYYNNIAPGGHDIDSVDNFGGRAQLRWAPTENFDATTRVDYFSADQFLESYDHLLAPLPFATPLANSLVGGFGDVALDGAQTYKMHNGGVSEELTWGFAPNFTLTSITAWRSFDSTAFNDNDASEANFLYFRSTADTEQLSQEFNLRYNGDRLTFVAGAFYFSADEAPGSRVVVPPSAFTPANRSAIRYAHPNIETESIALFGQLDYNITPDLSVLVGLRYTEENVLMDQNFEATSLNPATLGANLAGFPVIYSIERTDDALTPKFGINYQLTDDAFLYFSATRGFKSGGFNSQGPSPLTAGYSPEFIWSYEFGAKTEWLDRRLRLNLTGFHYDYEDLQVRQLLGPGNSVIVNAATAVVDGVEIEIVALPTPDLQITLNGAWIDAHYDEFNSAAVPGALIPYIAPANLTCLNPTTCNTNASGNRLSDTPEWTGLVALDYTPSVPGNFDLAFHIDYSYRTERFFDASNVAIASQDGYGLLNGNITLSPVNLEGWEISLFGRNLLDERYYQTVSGNGIVPGGIVGAPSTYGIRLGYEW